MRRKPARNGFAGAGRIIHHIQWQYRLAKTALVCGGLGFLLWLLSYSWVPFALTGHEAGALVSSIVKISEVSGLLVGLVSVDSGFIARRQAQAESAERRWASLGLALGTVAATHVPSGKGAYSSKQAGILNVGESPRSAPATLVSTGVEYQMLSDTQANDPTAATFAGVEVDFACGRRHTS